MFNFGWQKSQNFKGCPPVKIIHTPIYSVVVVVVVASRERESQGDFIKKKRAKLFSFFIHIYLVAFAKEEHP